MRLKATYAQRMLMLGFMLGVCLWAAWPDWRRISLVLMGAVLAGLWVLPKTRR